MTYFENMWPGHNGGGWFDTFDTHITEHYLEQAYLTAFSKPRELMLFCFQSLVDDLYTPALGFQMDKLDALLDHAAACDADIVDKLDALLDHAAACDADIVDKLERWLMTTGGDALVTTGFWRSRWIGAFSA